MKEQKFIKYLNISIGQSTEFGIPYGDPILRITINDRYSSFNLITLRDVINTICDSKGDRNEKAYEAKKQLDQFFFVLLEPWVDIDKNLEDQTNAGEKK